MNKKDLVLVTGGAGYVGAILVENLVKKGFRVRVYDALYFGEESLRKVKSKIELIKGDITDIPESIFSDVTSIIHLASISNDPTAELNKKQTIAVNTNATADLAKRAKNNGVKRFIFASSASIYDSEGDGVKTELSKVTPIGPYPLSKYNAEKELLKIGDEKFTVVILRKGTVYGYSPRMRYDLVVNAMVKNALQFNTLKVFNAGLQRRPLVSVADVAEAYIHTLTVPSQRVNKQIINISSGNYLVKDIAQIVKDVFKKSFRKTITISYEGHDKNNRSFRMDSKKSEKLLSFKPKVSIEKTVIELVKKIKSEKKSDFDNPIYYNILHMKLKIK